MPWVPEHRETGPLQFAEGLPVRPLGDEKGVGDEDPRRPGVRAENRDGLAGLDEEGLVVVEALQGAHDRPEALPVTGGLARTAVDYEVLGALGDLGVEVVHKHP